VRLGDALVAKGIINETQLKRALETQMICGGHLGTCLIELGYLDENRLGRVLADLLGVRYAHPGLFHNVEPEVIARIPAAVVEKLKVIPLNLKGRLLHVAMVEPKNLPALDELAFATSCRIEPWIAPEARIFEAMERYYGIPRRMRYISLCQQMDSEGEEPPRAVIAQAATASIGGVAPFPDAGPTEVHGSIVIPPSRKAAPAPASAAARPSRRPAPPEPDAPLALAESLCEAESVDDVAQAIIERVARGMKHAVLFMVRDDKATIWHSHGLGLSRERMLQLSFPVVDEPVFALPLGDPYYRGPVPADPLYRAFYAKLGLEMPAEALIVPAHFNDRLVAILYGDGGKDGRVEGPGEDYLKMMTQVSLTLNLLAIKRKIRSV